MYHAKRASPLGTLLGIVKPNDCGPLGSGLAQPPIIDLITTHVLPPSKLREIWHDPPPCGAEPANLLMELVLRETAHYCHIYKHYVVASSTGISCYTLATRRPKIFVVTLTRVI